MTILFSSQWPLLIGIGILVGILSGSLGVGGGIIMVPALTLLLGYPQKTAQGMSLFIIIPAALMSAIRYYNNPQININLWVVLLLAVAAVVGANIGSQFAFALPADLLKKIFAGFIIMTGILMLIK